MYNKKADILVSAYLITYNHEKYVAQALESMLMQKTNFNFEIFVADDCSTDKTPQILNEYKNRYPDRIRLFLREKNLGATKNSYLLRKEFKGRYLAPLEGDDYWLGTDRLQFLVDFLENNPQYVGVGHKRERRDTEGNLLGYDPDDEVLNKPFTINDFLEGKRYSFTGSIYRNYFLGIGDKYEAISLVSRNVGDFTQSMILLDMGNVFITDKCFGVYRFRIGEGESNYNSLFSIEEKYYEHLKIIEAVTEFFNGKYDLTRETVRRKFSMLRYFIKYKNFGAAKTIINSIKPKEFRNLFIILLDRIRRKLYPRRKNT